MGQKLLRPGYMVNTDFLKRGHQIEGNVSQVLLKECSYILMFGGAN
jgi:hypothetical protein